MIGQKLKSILSGQNLINMPGIVPARKKEKGFHYGESPFCALRTRQYRIDYRGMGKEKKIKNAEFVSGIWVRKNSA